MPSERRDHVAIALVSCAIVIYQITMMRVLSVVVWYHFAFLVLSLVMLGLSVPGVWFTFAREPKRHLPSSLALAGAAMPISAILTVRLGAGAMEFFPVLVVLFLLPATLAAGAAICLLLMRARGPAIGPRYGWDLVGAGVGAAAVIPLMHLVPTPSLAAGTGALPLAALLLQGRRAGAASHAGLVALAVLLLGTNALQVTRSKTYDEREVRPVWEEWSPIARITVFDESFFYLQGHESGFTWGRGDRYRRGEPVKQYWLEQDGSAGSPIVAYDGDLSPLDFLLYDVATAGLQLRRPSSVAVLGAGGGRDILSALVVGADTVDAVELNPATMSLVSARFRELSGDVYHAPGVRAITGEARSFLARSPRTYDLIQLSLADSWAASLAGAHALAENNLYTVEAFRLYRDRLNPGGVLSVSRWIKEMPWLVQLARVALGEDGIEAPESHLAVLYAKRLGTLLVSRDPFRKEDLDRLARINSERGFSMIHPMSRGRQAPDRFLVEVIERGRPALESAGIDARPPTDDRPYFFHFVSPFADVDARYLQIRERTGFSTNVEPTRVLQQTMLAVGVTALLLLFVAPVWVWKRKAVPGWTLVRGSLYFAGIGAGFMLFENVLIQRFVLYLGHPTYAATLVIAVLLLGMGAGSLSATRIGIDRLQRRGFLVVPALLLLSFGLPVLSTATLGWPGSLRALSASLVLLPYGVALGWFFPLGMLRFGDDLKPWHWAVNGFFGVVASVAALALSVELGFSAVGILAAGAYAMAWGCLRR